MTKTLFVQDENTGAYRYATPKEICAAGADAINRLYPVGTYIEGCNGEHGSKKLFSAKMANLEAERFAVIFLNNKHKLLAYEELFFGTIDNSSVHPREVVKRALHHNAAAVIFGHNHPSGIPEPSRADEFITFRLRDALALVDVRVLDHIVVGNTALSFAECGKL
jgi:DNA repair protein RadC